MAKRRMGLIAIMLCLCLLPVTAFAVSLADAKEPLDTGRECDLAISYRYDTTAFSGQTVKLYKVAELTKKLHYSLTITFSSAGLTLNGVQTNGEWNVIRSTLEAYILAKNIQPDVTVVTDENGQAHFEGLKPGLYLASAVSVEQEAWSYFFDSVLVAVPGLNTEGLWQYEVAVVAKAEVLPPVQPDEELQMNVLKLWRGDEGGNSRPQSIEVEIFHNGELWETVTLSEENSWSYSWLVKDDGAHWKAVERNIPEGYTMTISQRETTFVITNTLDSEDPTAPPQTGDTANVLLYVVLMILSGSMLIVLGIAGKRKRYEETN